MGLDAKPRASRMRHGEPKTEAKDGARESELPDVMAEEGEAAAGERDEDGAHAELRFEAEASFEPTHQSAG